MRVRIATRGSKLALIQAQLVAEMLAHRYPEHQFVLEPLSTHGDRHPQMSLAESPREGVFVKELERALVDGRAELAVHSAKDLPTLETPGLRLAAFPTRADARDVLISRMGTTLMELPRGARVGTGSPRRAAQIAAVRPDLVIEEIRGNVDTRLRRLHEGAVDALILAAAGLERLGRIGEAHERLGFDLMLPAPGQGALAVQAVEGSEAARLAGAIDDPKTSRAVRAERALLRRLGGGCLSALGAYAAVVDGELDLQAVVLDGSGARAIRAGARGSDDSRVVEDVAMSLEQQGADRLLNEATSDRRSGQPYKAEADNPALAGLRVLVTRANGQASSLANALRARGAEVVLCPVIEIEPIPVPGSRLGAIASYDWLVLTSANGVERLFQLLAEAGMAIPAHIKVAAIGPETAARLRARGVEPTLVPKEYVAEDLAEHLLGVVGGGTRLLLARAAGAREILSERLRGAGAVVDVLETYRAVPPAGLPARLEAALSGVDIVTFTSSSTVRAFVEAVGTMANAPSLMFACIGPITARTAKEFGLAVAIIAQEYTTGGLVDAIVRSRAPVSA